MSATIRLPAPLRATVGGETFVPIDAADLASLPGAIADRYPELAARVLRDGTFGRFITVFVDGEDARFLAPETDLTRVRVVELLPAMSGGSDHSAACDMQRSGTDRRRRSWQRHVRRR
jgi:molybdopterin converting factor small subunit